MSEVPRLTPAEIDRAYTSAQKVVETHRRIAAFLRVGQTLGQIDTFVAKTLEELDCVSCFRGYPVAGHPPFPSHACLSVNECVVHGTAGYYREPMKPGDILKIDIGVWHHGWVGDAGWTYVFGPPTPLVKRLTESGKLSLSRGIAMMEPGRRYLDWAITVQDVVEKEFGFFCVENWGGHGIGKKVDDKQKRGLHLPPHLLNHRPLEPGGWPEAGHTWKPGNLVAVEPMIGVGTGKTVQKPFAMAGIGRRTLNDWPVYIADGSLAVHYEHDVLITEQGPRILTEGMESLPDIIAV